MLTIIADVIRNPISANHVAVKSVYDPVNIFAKIEKVNHLLFHEDRRPNKPVLKNCT